MAKKMIIFLLLPLIYILPIEPAYSLTATKIPSISSLLDNSKYNDNYTMNYSNGSMWGHENITVKKEGEKLSFTGYADTFESYLPYNFIIDRDYLYMTLKDIKGVLTPFSGGTLQHVGDDTDSYIDLILKENPLLTDFDYIKMPLGGSNNKAVIYLINYSRDLYSRFAISPKVTLKYLDTTAKYVTSYGNKTYLYRGYGKSVISLTFRDGALVKYNVSDKTSTFKTIYSYKNSGSVSIPSAVELS